MSQRCVCINQTSCLYCPPFILHTGFSAVHRTTQAYIKKNIITYCECYIAKVPLEYDPKSGQTTKMSRLDVVQRSIRLIVILTLTLTVIANSFRTLFNYSPFVSPLLPIQYFPLMIHFFHWEILLNDILVAEIRSINLDRSTLAVGFGISPFSWYNVSHEQPNTLLNESVQFLVTEME